MIEMCHRVTEGKYVTSHDQVSVWEQVLGLHESAGVARMEQVEDPISVNSDRTVGCENNSNSNRYY